MAEGIERRHSRTCPVRRGGRCRCNGGYQASIYSSRDGKKIRKTFAREAEAKSWRAAAKRKLDHGSLRAPSPRTLSEVAERWLEGAKRGEIRNRSGHSYKPSVLRGYQQALEDRVLPELGSQKVSALTTSDLQALIDGWQAEGYAGSTIRNWITPLQAIYRRARAREGLPVNPTQDLELPARRLAEIEIVSPQAAARLLDVVPADDKAIWATALYAGLRYGELRALRWSALNPARGVLEVRESWDPREGSISPKSRKSRRTVPMPGLLRDVLLNRRMRCEPAPHDLVFGEKDAIPFRSDQLYTRADRAWRKAKTTERLRLHQARHTYASFMIAAGVNAKALSTFMGHSTITVTFDLYGHLMPGTEAEGATLLDTYLARQVKGGEQAARAAELHNTGATGAQTGAQRRKTA